MQIEAIKNLNGLIRKTQGMMVATKKSYEAAVQARNATGEQWPAANVVLPVAGQPHSSTACERHTSKSLCPLQAPRSGPFISVVPPGCSLSNSMLG